MGLWGTLEGLFGGGDGGGDGDEDADPGEPSGADGPPEQSGTPPATEEGDADPQGTGDDGVPDSDTVADRVGVDYERLGEGRQVVTAEADARMSDGGTNTTGSDEPGLGDETLASEDLAAHFRAAAADLVEQWPGYDLDNTPASLERLDSLVAAEFAEFDFSDVALGAEDDDSLFLTARSMEAGGYLAEVFRRTLGGEWRDEDGITFVVAGRDGETHVDPVGVAAGVFRGEASFAATCEALRDRLSMPEQERPDSGDVPETSASADAPGDPPRGTAEAFAARHPAYGLDFTPGSLSRLDALVEEFPEPASEDATDGARAYLGETIVRCYDAAWTHGEDAGWVLAATDETGEQRVFVLPAVLEDCLAGEASFVAAHDAFVDVVGLDGPTLDAEGPDAEVDSDADEDSDADDGSDPVIGRLSAKAAVDAAGEDLAREPAADVGEDRRAAAGDLADGWPAYDLDFSVESLVRLDSLVADRYDFSGGDREYDGDPLSVPEGAKLSIPTDGSVEAFGGYLAAVFERYHEAVWCRGEGGEVVLVVEGTARAVDLEPEMVAIACFAGESSFVDAYARVAADVGLEPAIDR